MSFFYSFVLNDLDIVRIDLSSMGITTSSTSSYSTATNKDHYDCKVKMVLLGGQNVGTSAMVKDFWDEQQQYQTYVSFEFAAGGVEVNIKTLDFRGKRVRTELADNAGRILPSDPLAEAIYDNANAVLICYSHRKRSSFDQAKKWLEHTHRYAMKVLLTHAHVI